MTTEISRARRVARHVPSALFSIAVSAVAMPAAMSFVPAMAQEAGFAQQLDEVRNSIGLGRPRPPIDFTERPPLVVPPTTTLPPPSRETTSVGVNDPDVYARQKALTDPRRPVPPSDPGANAQGLNSRTYLIDPPSGMRDPAAVASAPTTDASAPERKTVRKRKAHKPAVEAAQ